MRSKERLLDVLKSVNTDLFDADHACVIKAAASALEKGPISSKIANLISDRILDFGSPHIRELLTEAVSYIEKMKPVGSPLMENAA